MMDTTPGQRSIGTGHKEVSEIKWRDYSTMMRCMDDPIKRNAMTYHVKSMGLAPIAFTAKFMDLVFGKDIRYALAPYK